MKMLSVVGCSVKLLESASGNLRLGLFDYLLDCRSFVDVDCDGAPQDGGDVDRPRSGCA